MLDFGVGWSELLLIGIVALIVIGPKELPGALRALGQWMSKIRKMAGEFQGQFQEAMREAEIDQLKKDMDDMAAKAKSYVDFDPVADVRRDIEKTIGDLPPLDQPAPSPTQSATAPEVATAPPAPAPPASTSEPAASATDEPQLPFPEPAAAAEPAPAAPEPVLADGKPDAGRPPA